MKNIQEIIQEIRSDFSLVNLREEVERDMECHDLHMEDIMEIGGTGYIYDGPTEEFFGMLEYYYDENAADALMFEIRFKNGSRIYTEVDTDYNMVLVQYAMPPKDRGKIYFTNTLPPIMEREIAKYLNGEDPEYIKEALRIFRIPAESLKLPDEDQ